MKSIKLTFRILWLILMPMALASVSAPAYLFADELDNPPVPNLPVSTATDTDSVRVALVDSGVNYLLPEIAEALARDAMGNLIGYDFWDMDAQPFDSHPVGGWESRRSADGRPTQSRHRDGRPTQRHGTRTASLLIREAPFIQLVAYRYPRPDMQRMADLVAHADSVGVRVIGLPLGGNKREQWTAFEAAAIAHPHILFVASAGNNDRDIDQQPVYPAALTLENMLVVSSADDFGRIAQGVNWGRVSVDYMVPAEQRLALGFDGSEIRVSGSSYAVPRVVALAARFLQNDPFLTVPDLLSLLRSRFANGMAPRQLAQGFLFDPQIGPDHAILIESTTPAGPFALGDTPPSNRIENDQPQLTLPLQLLVLDERWSDAAITSVLDEVARILGQCRIGIASTGIQTVSAPDYLRDLEVGSARTLMEAVRSSGDNRKLTVVFARDTRMSIPFDAEAFGRGNTRHRPWLTDSVWLTLALQDRAIALAHEMFHVLVNSGEHSTAEGSLMLARTTGDNTRITAEECMLARERAQDLGLVAISDES